MESISLIPSKPYSKSIYKADQKNCNDGLIILEDRITEYYMDVQETTAVSIDTSLLHQTPNSAIQFTLIVYSTGNNVLNLSGFNVEQIQVWNGKSVFTVMKGVGDANWNIQMTSSDVRPEQRLVCYTIPFVPTFNSGVFNVYNFATDSYSNMFSDIAVGQQTSNTYGQIANTTVMDNGYICAKFPTPIWLTKVSISRSTNTNYGNERFPNHLQVLASNDGIEWTQILDTSLDNSIGAVNICTCTPTNYYTFFKFKYLYPTNTTSTYFLPPIALMGFISELIGTGAYVMATPYCASLPLAGYDIETNSSQMTSVSGDVQLLTQYQDNSSNFYIIERGSNDVPFEFVYTFPDAIRTIGIVSKDRYTFNMKLFTLSYSDDKETWTEYCKVDGTLEAWNQGLKEYQCCTYFCDSKSEHKYYKITVYTLSLGTETGLYLNGLGFLKFQKGHYFTFESFVPKLSSNTQAGYMLISSNSSEGDAYKLFDQSVTTYGGGQISDGQWSLLISLPEATVVRGLEMVAPSSEVNRMPYAFSLQGSQDNDTWTNIKSFLLGSNYWSSANQLGQWDIENETAYKYYRLVVTNTAQGSYVRIGELGLSSYASFKGVNWYEDEYPVPVMTANEQDGYVASAKSSFDSSYQPWKAFDRTNNNGVDCWACSNADMTNYNKECNVWLQIQLPTAQVFHLLNIVSRQSLNSQAPSSFTLKGSNDNETWTDLLTVINESTYSDKTWNFENSTAYSYYRIDIVKTNSANDHVSVAELNFIKRIYHESN